MNSKKINSELDLIGDKISDLIDTIDFNDENNADLANDILEDVIGKFVDLVELIESDEKLGES